MGSRGLIGLMGMVGCGLLMAAGIVSGADSQLELGKFQARGGNITAVGISNDGSYLITGEDYGQVTLWNVKTGALMQKLMGHSREIFAAAILADGKRGVTCGDDDLIIVWELATGERLQEIDTDGAIPLALSCSPDGAFAATGCYDGRIIIWNLATGKRAATLPHGAQNCGVRYSPDGKMLAAGYADGEVIVWDTSNWRPMRSFPPADDASVGALGFTMDSRLLVTGNQDGEGFVWDLASGKEVSHFAGYANPEASPSPPQAPVFPGSRIEPDNRTAVVFVLPSPDGSNILAPIQDETPQFWDTKTGLLLGTADWYEDNRFYIARFGFTYPSASYTPDRQYIATTNENFAQVWRCSFTPVPIPQ